MKSIYLNDTPVEGSNGAYNFSGVDVVWRAGHQVQDPLPGQAAAETEVAVGVEIKAPTPLVRTITNPDVDRVRVLIGVPSLVSITNEGDRKGASVSPADRSGGGWQLGGAENRDHQRQDYQHLYRVA
ncbi:hypothetical protein MBH78_19155 [Oceanimonas sp. NS1]|nr:hypothetical protein [Oceanimonas sp. NS1]